MKRFIMRKLKKNKSKRIILILSLFIAVGYSSINTNLNISGMIRFKTIKYDASEVGYVTVFNSLVTTVEDALNDLFGRDRGISAEEVGYTNELNPEIDNVQEALDEMYETIPNKEGNEE